MKTGQSPKGGLPFVKKGLEFQKRYFKLEMIL